MGGRTIHAFKTGAGAEPTTLGLAVDSGLIYSLYWNTRGAPDDRRRILDIYRLATGAYLGSRRLPLPTSATAVRGDVVYALTTDGNLHIWRWVGAASPPR